MDCSTYEACEQCSVSLAFFPAFFCDVGAKKSTPTEVKGGAGVSRSGGKSATFWF